MNKATNAKKQILASQIAYKRTQNNEAQLEKALAKFFNKLKKEVLNALDEYWKDYQMLQGHIDLITAPVHEAHKEYYELLTLYIKREYRLGSAEAKRLVKLANSKQRVAGKSMRMPVRAIIKKDNDLFGTLPSAEERLLNRTFTASERTLSRVDSQINQIITDGYRSGKGINDVANSLTQRFDQLTSWESKRIARTEIHNSHNVAVMDTYKELDVEYTMWIAAEDERTRDSHLEINGEIIPMGGEYSNGLKYPGDTSGDIEEWINCRCSNAPFVVPYGFMAPSFSPFREDDLIKVDTKPQVSEPQPVNEPTEEQIQQNLTPKEQKQLEFFEKNIKESEQWLIDNPNATPKQIEAIQNEIKQKGLKIEELKTKALGQVKPVEPITPITETSETIAIRKDTIETFRQETPLNDFDKVMKWADKRTKGKIEYGYKFDTRTGKIVGKEIRGSKGKVTMLDDGKHMGSLHIHTADGMSFPSDTDIISYRCMKESEHYILSQNEMWYVHAEENLGMMGRLTQMDVTKAYGECIKEGNKAVETLMREGKIGLDEKSIKRAADKEIGDRLLKEFSKPKWKDKGLEVRRAYR